MSSFFTHLFVPLVILQLFAQKFKIDQKKVLALSFFAVLPDLDAIILPHRAVFHNVFILIIPLLLFILDKKRREIYGIICFFLVTHLILDIFKGGIFFLYPIYDIVLFANIELWFIFNENIFVPSLEWGISDTIMNNGIGDPAISSENIAIIIVMLICCVIWAILKLQKNSP